jgi:hypothetical protein
MTDDTLLALTLNLKVKVSFFKTTPHPHVVQTFHNHVKRAGRTNMEQQVPGFLCNGLLNLQMKVLNYSVGRISFQDRRKYPSDTTTCFT